MICSMRDCRKTLKELQEEFILNSSKQALLLTINKSLRSWGLLGRVAVLLLGKAHIRKLLAVAKKLEVD